LISEIFVTDKPSSPLNLTAPEVLADSITLRWEAPEDNGGSEITGYVIEKREFNRRSWQEVTKVKDLECTIGKLLEGNQYYFRVFAQNEIIQ
jgi:titin